MSAPFFPPYSQPFAVPMTPFMQPTFGMYPQPVFPSMYSPFVGPTMMNVNMFQPTAGMPSMVPTSMQPIGPCVPRPSAHPRQFQSLAMVAPAQQSAIKPDPSRRLPTVNALSVLQHDADKDLSSENGDALSPARINRKPSLLVDSSACVLPTLETMTPSASAFCHVKPEPLSPAGRKGKHSRENSPQPADMTSSASVQPVGIALPITKSESPRFYQLSPSASICSDRTAESSASSAVDVTALDPASALPQADDLNHMPLKRICIASRRNLPSTAVAEMPVAAADEESDADTARALLDLIHGSAAPSETDAAADSKEVVKIIYLEPARRRPRKLPMKCTYAGCPYEFNKTSSLKRHLRSHSGEKPFECTIPGCGMRFSEKGNMLRHRDVHFKEKRFQCKVDGCTHNFTRKAHLITHCLARHGVTLK